MADSHSSEASELRLAIVRAVGSWPVVGAVALMLANDQILKQSGWLPSVLTGKLSDFAFLFFAPLLVAFVIRTRSWLGVLLSSAGPALLLVAINVSPWFSARFAGLMSCVYPMVLWPDPTDLSALASVPAAWAYLRRLERRALGVSAGPSPWRALVVGLAALACVATTPAYVPTHQPVYMSWDEFRSTAVAVLPPQPIQKAGKIVVHGDTLFISEPMAGVHILDNRDASHPRQLLFLRIPGNVDIAVKEDLLYADSFVDLLVFRLDRTRSGAVLVKRLQDQFPYDAYQALRDGQWLIRLDHYDPSKGVVIDAVPIQPKPAGQRSKR